MCPERCLACAIPAMQRRVDVHDDPAPAARRIGERMPAPSTGPGGLRLDATRVMSGHDDPGMRRRPDPHPRQRPGDSMPAGVHAAPERRRWCRGGGGRRGGCRVHGRAGGAAALPQAAAAKPMPVIMATIMIRFRLTAIGFLMRFLLAQTEAAAQIAVVPQDTQYYGCGGRSVHSVPARSNMGFDR
jgi:hypothetical protein